MGQPVRGRTRGCLGNQEKEPLRNPGLDSSVDDAEFVITSGQSSPLLQTGVSTLDHVAALVLDGVELRWPAALGPTPEPMSLLIRWFGNDCLDPPPPQERTVRFRRVRLVAKDRVRAGASTDFQVLHQRSKHRAVAVLASRADRHQRQSATVDELMSLCRQAPAGPTQGVVRRLGQQILVIRRVPFLRG